MNRLTFSLVVGHGTKKKKDEMVFIDGWNILESLVDFEKFCFLLQSKCI